MKVRTIAQAADYIDRVGFCLLFPIKGLRLPNLWAAVKGHRSARPPWHFDLVAGWDADTERMWGWKDELPRRRLAYYGKYFRARGSLISLAFLPCFYRLEGNCGAPDEYERLYREGRLTADAHAVARELFRHGPLPVVELRCRTFGTLELQLRLLVVHWGTQAETAAWESAVYELTPRAFPRAARAALKLAPEEARRRIAAQYRKLNPAATPADFKRLVRYRCAARGRGFGYTRGTL